MNFKQEDKKECFHLTPIFYILFYQEGEEGQVF